MCSVDYKPINPTAIGGHTGFYFFVERCFIYKYVVFLKDPPNAISFFNSVKQMCAYFSSYQKTITHLRLDAGTVEAAKDAIERINLELHITVNPAAPECQYQNPAERSIQTLLKGVGTMFVVANYLSNSFWALAIISFLDACNCTPNKRSGEYSPHFHLTGQHPNIDKRFRFVFGQPVVSILLKVDKQAIKQTNTFAPAAEYGYAVGSIELNFSTLVYLPHRSKSRVYIRKDVRPLRLKALPPIAEGLVDPVNNTDGSTTFPMFPAQEPLNVQTVEQPEFLSTNESTMGDNIIDVNYSYTFSDINTSNNLSWNQSMSSPHPGVAAGSHNELSDFGG
jgi:hypothetical protein